MGLAPTDQAVLAALLLGPATAPELAELFAGPLGPIYRLQKVQVYRALDRLQAQGLAALEGQRPSPSGPPALRFALTPRGRAEAEAWLRAPVRRPLEARVHLPLKLALHLLLGQDPRPFLAAQEEVYRGLLEGLEAELQGAEGPLKLRLLWRREMLKAGLRALAAYRAEV